MRERLEPLPEMSGGLSLLERRDQIGEGAVVDAAAVLGRGDRQAQGKVRLPDARRPKEDHVLLALHEAELVQALDLLALDRGLKGEIEVAEQLHRPESDAGSAPGLVASLVGTALSPQEPGGVAPREPERAERGVQREEPV